MPRPRHPHDLATTVASASISPAACLYRWEFEKDGKEIELAVQGSLILDEDHLIGNAAVDGAGLAFVFEDYLRAPLADGRLIRVLEDWCPPFDGFFVYYPSRRQMRPALRAFVDFFKVGG